VFTDQRAKGQPSFVAFLQSTSGVKLNQKWTQNFSIRKINCRQNTSPSRITLTQYDQKLAYA
jgi:hypothetical protein